MIYIGDPTEQQTNNRQKDNQQDTRIDSLQSAVDELNAQVYEISVALDAISEGIDDKYNAQTQTLMAALTSKINELTEYLATVVSTAQVNADVGNFKYLAATVSATLSGLSADVATITQKAIVKDAEIETLEADSIDADALNATIANLETANINLLNVTSFVVTALTVEKLTAEEIEAESAKIKDIEADKINTRNITGKEWRTPISTPNNAQLLHIFIPKYKGVVQMQTQEDEFSLTILNDSAMSYNQNGEIIYRVEKQDNGIDVYLHNLGDTVNYRILHIGSEAFLTEWSEIVYKSPYDQNISGDSGTLFFSSNGIIQAEDLDALSGIRGNIQAQIDLKQNVALATPLVLNGGTYTTVEGILFAMNAVLNGILTDDIIYNEAAEELIFPFTSIHYDVESEEIDISGFNVEYENEELRFTR